MSAKVEVEVEVEVEEDSNSYPDNDAGFVRCCFCGGPVGDRDLCELCSKEQQDTASAAWVRGYAGCFGIWVCGFWQDHDGDDAYDESDEELEEEVKEQQEEEK